MRYLSLTLGTCLGLVTAVAAGSVYADSDLEKAAANPANFAMPRLNNAATAYSTLKQINASNVGKLQVAWTFSTGVLRGHEGWVESAVFDPSGARVLTAAQDGRRGCGAP